MELRLSPDHLIIFSDFRDVNIISKADLIFADPPFGIGFKAKHRTYARKHRVYEYVEVPKDQYPQWIRDLAKWCYNALKPHGSMWLVSGWSNLREVLNAVHEAGFHMINHAIWHYNFGVYTKRRLTTSHYHLLYLSKHKTKYTFNKLQKYMEDVWYIRREFSSEPKAANELPLELVKRCVLIGSNEGDLVIDPVLGSGTTMLACMLTNRRCVGIEINENLKERILVKCRADRISSYLGSGAYV